MYTYFTAVTDEYWCFDMYPKCLLPRTPHGRPHLLRDVPDPTPGVSGVDEGSKRVIAKIMVSIIIRHLLFRVPKKGHQF